MSELEAQEFVFYLNAVALLMGGYFSYRSQDMIRQPHALVFLLMISVVMLVTRLIVKMPIPYLIIHFTTVVVCMMLLAGIVLWLAHDFKQEAHDKAEQERTKLPEGMERVFDGGAMQVRHSKYGTEVNEDLYYKVQPKQEPKPEPVKEEKKEEFVLNFDLEDRFAHQFVIASPGSGKTSLLVYQLWHDIQHHDRTVVVFDSENDLINQVKSFDIPAERLVVIEPSVEYPPQLGLFDIDQEHLTHLPKEVQNEIKESSLAVYDYIFDALGVQITGRQRGFVRYVTRLMLEVPNATIHTLQEFLADGGRQKYQSYINRMSKSAQLFFNEQFDTAFKDTRTQILTKLLIMTETEVIGRMLSAPKSKIRLADELDIGGKVIIIDCNANRLQDNAGFFGRFILGQILTALEKRINKPRHERTPVFVYIDEAQLYCDETVSDLLARARKRNCGLILATQKFDSFKPEVQSAVTDCQVQIVGRVVKDAARVAKIFNADASSLTRGNWYANVAGQTNQIQIPYPFHYPKRTDHWRVRDLSRQKYCEKWVESFSTENIVTIPKDPPDYSPKGTNPRNKKT